MARRSSGDPTNLEPVAALDAASGPVVTLPAGFSLLALTFARAGADLVLTAPDSRIIVISDFFAVAAPPDLADADGHVLAGEIAARLGAGDLVLTPEELALITGFVTAAGGGGADAGFGVDVLDVTWDGAGGAPPAAAEPPEPSIDRFVFGAASGGPDGHSPTLAPVEEPPPVPPNPTRIRDLQSDGWSDLPFTFRGYVPDPADEKTDYYKDDAPTYVESNSKTTVSLASFLAADVVQLREFRPPDGDPLLFMSSGSIAAPDQEGSKPGNSLVDINRFMGLPDTAGFGPGVAPVDGVTIVASVSVAPGDVLVLDALFDPYDTDTVENDFAFVIVDGDVFRFAEVADGDVFRAADPLTTMDDATGWMTLAIQNASDRITEFALGVMNSGDALNDPALAIDRLRIETGLPEFHPHDVVTIGTSDLQVISEATGTTDPNTIVSLLGKPPVAGDEAIEIGESGFIDSASDAATPGLLDNDSPPSMPSPTVLGGVELPLEMAIIGVTVTEGGSPQQKPVGEAVTVTSAGGREGLLRVTADGIWTFDTDGNFGDLVAGETDTVSFSYTVAVPSHAFDIGQVTVTVAGTNDPKIVEDFERFERDVLTPGTHAGNVDIVDGFERPVQPGQPDQFDAQPADGTRMLKIDAEGGFAAFLWQDLLLGRDPFDPAPEPLPIDVQIALLDEPGDGSVADVASAYRLDDDFEPGQVVSFYWWFDNAELGVQGEAAALPGFSDRGLFTVLDLKDPENPILLDVFRLVDGRKQYDIDVTQNGLTDAQARAGHLESYWTSWAVPALDDPRYGLDARYLPGEAYQLGLGWGLLNDEGSSGYPDDPDYPDGESVLLIDLVQVDAPVPTGYSSDPVNSLSDGMFQTFAPDTV